MLSSLLSQRVKVDFGGAATGAGTSAVNGSSFSMVGYEGAMFFSRYGTPAANNVAKLQQSDDDGVADDWTDLAGSQVVAGASDENQFVEVFKPTKKFVRPVFARGTSSTLGEIWCIRYGARNLPVQNVVSGTTAGKSVASPAEGTA